MKNLRNLGAILLAFLAVTLTTPAQAIITLEKVKITCGPACQTERNRMEMMIVMQLDEIKEMLETAYASRTQWQDMYDEVWYMAAYSLDLRCNAMAKLAVGTVINAQSTVANQKTAAEQGYLTMKNGMTPVQLSKWIADLPKSSGTTTNGASYPATTKIMTVVWFDGSQSSFTFVETGSGWAVGQHTGWKYIPPGETAGHCPPA